MANVYQSSFQPLALSQPPSGRPPFKEPPFYRPTFRELPYAMKKHWATRLHDDLRLQWNGVLLSWALTGEPICYAGESREAIEMEDHDRQNILFEGVHRTGTIMVWDCGSWEPLTGYDDVLACLERGYLKFILRGGKVQGIWTLTRISSGTDTRRAVWILRKESELFDRPAVFNALLEIQPLSICSQRTKEEIDRDWKNSRSKPPLLFH